MLLPPASHSTESHRTTLNVNFADAVSAMNPAFIAHRSLRENSWSIASQCFHRSMRIEPVPAVFCVPIMSHACTVTVLAALTHAL